jgi:hypothetical protein
MYICADPLDELEPCSRTRNETKTYIQVVDDQHKSEQVQKNNDCILRSFWRPSGLHYRDRASLSRSPGRIDQLMAKSSHTIP